MVYENKQMVYENKQVVFENEQVVFENEQVVFDPETNVFVHPDGGRQNVYSNLVYYPDRVVWNPNVIDPDLKQQALEHCLGLSLGPQPSKRASGALALSERTEGVAPVEQSLLALPEPNCTQSGPVSPRSSENNSLSCKLSNF